VVRGQPVDGAAARPVGQRPDIRLQPREGSVQNLVGAGPLWLFVETIGLRTTRDHRVRLVTELSTKAGSCRTGVISRRAGGRRWRSAMALNTAVIGGSGTWLFARVGRGTGVTPADVHAGNSDTGHSSTAKFSHRRKPIRASVVVRAGIVEAGPGSRGLAGHLRPSTWWFHLAGSRFAVREPAWRR